MSKSDKIQSVCLLFMLVFGALILFSKQGLRSPVLDSLAYINEHLFTIFLLLFIRYFIESSIGLLTIYGLIVFKIELIVFNIFLAFKTKEDFDKLSTAYDIGLYFTISIWLIILLCLLAKKYLR